MSDAIPPAPSELEDASKAETIRITLPPKQDQQAIKRETVRINLPGKGASVPPTGTAPKKETTKIAGGLGAPTPAPEAPKSYSPPPKPPLPPAPPSAPTIPSGMQRPLAGPTPNRPPMPGARPTVPLKPAPPVPGSLGAGATPMPVSAPVTQRAAAPKKETARITLPSEGAKPALPKATVKMQQTQPLVNRPPQTLSTTTALTTAQTPVGAAAPDGSLNMIGIAALIVSLASLVATFLAYSAAAPQ